MPLPGARYRWKTYPSGKKVRLAFRGKNVVEAKSGQTGDVHTASEFAADRARRAARKRTGTFRRKKSFRQINAAIKRGQDFGV